MLAFLLALTNPEVNLSSTERSDLNRVGRFLKRGDDWQLVQEGLNKVIEENPILNQVYQNYFQKFKVIDINKLLAQLPSHEELIEEFADDLIARGSFEGKPDRKNNEIKDIFIPLSQKEKPDEYAMNSNIFDSLKHFLFL
ncbi:hypothetical protein [Nostoc sp.]|uniref:hypothetical protein n=1 Tax=Nostoc sp. TaxID=1180 RepID=UPI002FF57689